ncbi:cell wall-associated NlpC family hydrolase [Rhizobium sp. SG_E_25_P2]|uniref:C40 family peptidase n=1 Tax=Rhizobium sp. SG_E_25_P2 TaxID=2879942 RepID=UPI0024746CE2|nr:NlpC/P60 family protein [Rhizobium sp. SG_E_25_P2]MDH6265320.1 cell wall-associated NlpC family hydrolase [Rhizobium sp. SG_E_25_P2]
MTLDRRIFAFRPDLAEASLQGRVEAARFTEGSPAQVRVPKIALRAKPDVFCGLDTELMLGEPVTILDVAEGWAWVKSGLDDYVGYLPQAAIIDTAPLPTHWVTVPRTFLYPEPDMKRPPIDAISMGSRITVTGEAETRGTRYLLTTEGAVIARHLAPLVATISDDYVDIASLFLETPYLWGGRTGFGLDCSGLVQLSMMMAGQQAPRDSDQQAAMPGEALERAALARGDLVFWKGHVGIMEDHDTLLHANGHTMSVARERLDDAIGRISPLYGEPTGFKRPDCK